MNWTPTFPLERLPVGTARVFKQDRQQIAIFHLEGGQVYAIDNHCPHEGYPLAQGAVSGCILTCKWHNFKFDLRDGACVMGEEPVRGYPLRVEDGVVLVDLDPPESLLRGFWNDLEAALTRQEMGRAARNVVRLLDLGVKAETIALFGACFDADRGEYGLSHAMAVCEEVTLREIPGVEPALPLVQALDMCARNVIRLPKRPVAEAIDPGNDPVKAGEQVRDWIEAEDARAVGMVRGAVAKGWKRAELEPWFYQVCVDHFLDFGHELIYSTKVFDLLDRAGWEGADSLLSGLMHGILCGTREDLLPAWASWRKRVQDVPPVSQPTLSSEVLIEADTATAFQQVSITEDPLNALSIAAAERLLRFDVSVDRSADLAEGWLDVTHRLTFVHAVRVACERWKVPASRRLLLQAAHFVSLGLPLDGPRRQWEPIAGSLSELSAAVIALSTDEAVSRALGWLQAGGDARLLVQALEQIICRDHAVREIFMAHHLKTLRAAEEERLATGDDRPLLAAVRYLASPARERNLERTVNNAISLVREGKPPKSLT